LLGFVLLSLVAWVLLMYGGSPGLSTLLDQASYAVLVLSIGLLALTATYLWRPAAVLTAGLSAGWFVLAWIVRFLESQPGVLQGADWPMVALGLFGAGGLVLLGWQSGLTVQGLRHVESSGGLTRA
jgi:hypothetical protein